MKKYKIAISNNVYDDLENIANFILSKNTQTSVDNYLKSLYEDISTLEHLAGVLPYSEWETVKKIHPEGKRLLSRNKQWNILFHLSGDYVIVDKILPSTMIID